MNPASTRFILGYHGCDRALAERVFADKASLKASQNDYDWLGDGICGGQSGGGIRRARTAHVSLPIADPVCIIQNHVQQAERDRRSVAAQ